MSAGRVIALVFLLAVAVGAIYGALVTVDHSGEEIYAIPDWGLALTLAFAGVVLIGVALATWSRQWAFAAVVTLAGTSLAFAYLAGFTVGLVALPLSLGLVVWAIVGSWPGPRKTAGGIGGALAGVFVIPLAVAAATDPVVSCEPDGSSGGENVFMGMTSQTVHGSTTDAVDGPSSGSASSESYEYSYTCQDGRLVAFDFRWK